MNKIFISYRRSDSSGISGRIYDRLRTRFGTQSVFKDVLNLKGGDEWMRKIREYISSSAVMLVVIGPGWLAIRDDIGNRRLDDSTDPLRQEIEQALNQANMTIIPILVDGARMPNKRDLPESFARLADFQGREVREDPDFDSDMRNLIADIERNTGLVPQTSEDFDDAEPADERQLVLTAFIEENRRRKLPLLSDVVLNTRGELEWAKEYLLEHPLVTVEDRATIDLSSVILANVNLRGTSFRNARLHNADLYGTDLTGVDFFQADLRGADLRRSQMDVATTLQDTLFGTTTKVGDIAWNNVSLLQVDWDNVPILGDEIDLKVAKTRKQKIQKLQEIIRAYSGLAIALRQQGLHSPASKYRYRENCLRQRLFLLKGNLPAWVSSLTLNVTTGYGERPARALLLLLIIILVFAGSFYFAGLSGPYSRPLTLYEALNVSVTSFLGRGFFSPSLNLNDTMAEIGIVEGFCGLFTEILLIGSFSRRFARD